MLKKLIYKIQYKIILISFFNIKLVNVKLKNLTSLVV